MQRLVFLIICAIFTSPVSALTVLLYDGALGTTPDQQAWIPAGIPNPPAVTPAHNGQGVVIDTAASSSDTFGYFSEDPFTGTFLINPNMPVIDRAENFSIEFQLQVISEAHQNINRAGFSVIVISQDLQGIEISFFEDEIWAQGVGFVKQESVARNTQNFAYYRIVATEQSYTLQARASEGENYSNILTGPWRNYNPTGINVLRDPYNNPSFLFFGDNTTSAAGAVVLGDIRMVTGPLPEPAEVVTVPYPAVMVFLFGIFLIAIGLSMATDFKRE
ncbi:MAG: hypothetical protein AAF387_03440 [Pseudomonadota bacterium]